jgi:hypothetical protein
MLMKAENISKLYHLGELADVAVKMKYIRLSLW